MDMNTKKIILAALIWVLFTPLLAFSQEWSTAQKELWKIIETHWKALTEENQEKFLSNFHPNFKSFVNWRALPLDKENLGKWIEYMNKNTDISIYTIEPVAITVYDDVAIIQYYCDLSLAIPSGQQIRSSYRYTDILKKEKDKWLVIGAHKEEIK